MTHYGKPMFWGLNATKYVFDQVIGRMVSFKGRISVGGVPVTRKKRQDRRMAELSAHCHLYYDLKSPAISNIEYDAMKARLRAKWNDDIDGEFVIPLASECVDAMSVAMEYLAKAEKQKGRAVEQLSSQPMRIKY